ADFVQKSPAVNSNKMAAIRFCRYLSTAPEFLTSSQIDFIRAVAEKILEDNIQVHQIIVDLIAALAHSSAKNCLHTLTIYQPYLEMDFKLKLDVLQIVLAALVRYELSEELYHFIERHNDMLWFDFQLTGDIIRHLAKKGTYENEP